MSLDSMDLRAALEAMIFAASEPLTRETLGRLLPDEAAEDVDRALEDLVAEHARPGRGLVLDRVAGGLRITTRPEVHAHVLRVVQHERAERLSLRTLETLAVIAYKQPVTAAEVGEIRGVDPSGTIKTLLDKGLVRIAGRKKVVGRPFVYGTTRAFLTTFGLDDLTELPTLKELHELGDLPATQPDEVESVDAEPTRPDPEPAGAIEGAGDLAGEGADAEGEPDVEPAAAPPADDPARRPPGRPRGADRPVRGWREAARAGAGVDDGAPQPSPAGGTGRRGRRRP